MTGIENSFEFDFDQGKLPSLEIINYLERRMKEKVDEYEVVVKQKDETIKKLNQRIAELESFIEELKAEKSKNYQDLLQQNKELILKIEESKDLLVKQKEKHQKEINLLKSIFDKTKADIDSLSKELDEIKKERSKLKEENINLLAEKERLESRLKTLDDQLSNAKQAVENTLGELLAERRKVDELLKKINQLQKDNEDLKKQLDSTKLAWDSERAQWKEMWERERSLWESHRMEFAVWEERLRNEREAWLKILKEEEAKGVENARKLAQVLEESSKWSYKVGELLKLYANKEIVLPHILTSTDTLKKKVDKGVRKVLFFAVFSFMILGSAGYIYYDWSRKLHLSLVASRILDDTLYTSFIKDDEVYLFTDPNKGIIVKDKEFKTIDIINEIEGKVFKPFLLTKEGSFIWVFDLSSLRFLKIDLNEKKLLSSIRSLTYAPQGLVSDGRYLWSFDGIGGVLQRYDVDGEINSVNTYELDGIKRVDSLSWMGEELIVISNSKLHRFVFKNDRFTKISSQKAKNFVYCYVYKDEIYLLKDMLAAKKIEIYKMKNKELL